jgi:hypothetical protein
VSKIGQDPFVEGKLAAAKGRTTTANPYSSGSNEHELWLEGYDYVKEADEDGNLN